MSTPSESKLFTYGDYLTWPDEIRCEIIDGVIYDMTPAPSTTHQRLLGSLFNRFFTCLDGKTCEVFAAPFDVRLPKPNEKDMETTTVVQPDIVVVCDPDKLDERGCKGAPDLIVEIISPSTSRIDLKIKLFLYERVGVKEYWIVFPNEKVVQVYQLDDNGKYSQFEVFGADDEVRVGIFEDLTIRLHNVFK
ncbi:Uma2 family endonuclease [Paenibacillus hamazuiensis]|uniref:Uma2 family endonuclease n=1 Tax=Paenibacillus hamazuiensis TaxID=2936508 RepID=UPI002010B6EF|nr:Uma2 family endonuclease [Paenibacillus hamazuiensis]